MKTGNTIKLKARLGNFAKMLGIVIYFVKQCIVQQFPGLSVLMVTTWWPPVTDRWNSANSYLNFKNAPNSKGKS